MSEANAADASANPFRHRRDGRSANEFANLKNYQLSIILRFFLIIRSGLIFILLFLPF